MNKTIIWIIVIAAGVAAGVGIWYWLQPSLPITPPLGGTTPTQEGVAAPSPAPEDTTAGINKDLEEVNLGDLDKDFESIDNDLKSL